MKRLTLALIGLVVLVVAGGIAQSAALPVMGVDFTFEQKHKCQGISPRIQLSNVPASAASYQVHMTDLDVPSFRHWSQTLPATGAAIPEGAGHGYYGPCPPSGKHAYQIEVTALDAQGKAIAAGSKTVDVGQ